MREFNLSQAFPMSASQFQALFIASPFFEQEFHARLIAGST